MYLYSGPIALAGYLQDKKHSSGSIAPRWLYVDDGTGTLDFSEFVLVMGEKSREADIETHFKDTFRVFSKDEDGENALEMIICESKLNKLKCSPIS